MVTPVYMTQTAKNASSICYLVEAPSDHQTFYVGIDLTNNTLTFSMSDDFAKPIVTIDLSGSDVEFVDVPCIKLHVANFVIAKMYSAFLKKEFPESFNYNLH